MSVGLTAFPEDVLIELSLEVEDLVDCTLLVIEEPNEEDFNTAGFGGTFLEPPNADTLGTWVNLPGTDPVMYTIAQSRNAS